RPDCVLLHRIKWPCCKWPGGVQVKSDPPPNKTETIGLALSGGGHRATIFALGALLYLFDVGANKAVRVVSSVSGASILNGYLGLLEKPLAEMSRTEFGA